MYGLLKLPNVPAAEGPGTAETATLEQQDGNIKLGTFSENKDEI